MTIFEKIGFKPRPHQVELHEARKRFNIYICHRRFGKTLFCCADTVEKVELEELENPRAAYFCPTKVQGKKVSWDYLKQLTEPLEGKPQEVELKIDFPHGGRINLGTAERPDYNRGIYLDHVVIDEPALMPTRLWSEILRPALSDRVGTATFIGTPQGRHGLLHTLWKFAEDDPDEWHRAMFKASETGVVAKKELESSKKMMTQDEYDQEFECSFAAAIKGAYLGRVINSIEDQGRICGLEYIQERPVHVCMDSGTRQENGCWFFQVLDSGSIHVLEQTAYPLMGIMDMIDEWREKPYRNYGKVIITDDTPQQTMPSARFQALRGMGFSVLEAPKIEYLPDTIENTRNILARTQFDATKCADGLEALRQFRADYDEKKEVFKNSPVIDWSYDSSISFNKLCTTIQYSLLNEAQEPDYSIMDRARRWG